MGVFVSKYGGDLIVLPLKDFVQRGRGDDFLILFDRLAGLNNNTYGTLTIGENSRNSDEYNRAIQALDSRIDSVMMVCIEDPESASPYLFTRSIMWDGKKYLFPVIFNAILMSYSECGEYYGFGAESFNLLLGNQIDPEQKCAMRIMYAPGERIEWNENDVKSVFSFL